MVIHLSSCLQQHHINASTITITVVFFAFSFLRFALLGFFAQNLIPSMSVFEITRTKSISGRNGHSLFPSPNKRTNQCNARLSPANQKLTISSKTRPASTDGGHRRGEWYGSAVAENLGRTMEKLSKAETVKLTRILTPRREKTETKTKMVGEATPTTSVARETTTATKATTPANADTTTGFATAAMNDGRTVVMRVTLDDTDDTIAAKIAFVNRVARTHAMYLSPANSDERGITDDIHRSTKGAVAVSATTCAAPVRGTGKRPTKDVIGRDAEGFSPSSFSGSGITQVNNEDADEAGFDKEDLDRVFGAALQGREKHVVQHFRPQSRVFPKTANFENKPDNDSDEAVFDENIVDRGFGPGPSKYSARKTVQWLSAENQTLTSTITKYNVIRSLGSAKGRVRAGIDAIDTDEILIRGTSDKSRTSSRASSANSSSDSTETVIPDSPTPMTRPKPRSTFKTLNTTISKTSQLGQSPSRIPRPSSATQRSPGKVNEKRRSNVFPETPTRVPVAPQRKIPGSKGGSNESSKWPWADKRRERQINV